MEFERLEFRLHTVERMFEREISTDDVRRVTQAGKVIEDYPNDKPFPSCLVLGYARNKPLHVVVATDKDANRAIIITVYEPDPNQWEPGFERRKQKWVFRV